MTDERTKTDAGGRHLRQVTLAGRVWYQICRSLFQILCDVTARPRCRGRRNVPKTGPVLIVANHQSYLDPPIIGSRILRRMNYLAKQELFESRFFGRIIRSVDAIPLDQHGLGFQGIKETLKRLRHGEMVLIFPEGMRSLDGRMNPFRRGYINVAVKTGATIVPAAIDGAWAMYPPEQRWPNFFKKRVRVEFGTPITPDDYKGMSEDELHKRVEQQVRGLFEKNRA